jgi:tRNA uridine 5-carbamoylmethylation protein Kti12
MTVKKEICIMGLVGLPGAGKTTFCRAYAQHLARKGSAVKLVVVALDELIPLERQAAAVGDDQKTFKRWREQIAAAVDFHIERATKESSGLHIERATNESSGLHIERATKESSGLHIERATNESSGLHIERATDESSGHHIERATDESSGLSDASSIKQKAEFEASRADLDSCTNSDVKPSSTVNVSSEESSLESNEFLDKISLDAETGKILVIVDDNNYLRSMRYLYHQVQYFAPTV